jgi:glucans biosynthesis protein C
MVSKASTRLYYLDWLRVLSILTVFIYHTSRLFNVEDFYVKNPIWYPWVEVWNRFSTTWLLPLIFVVSGASLYFAVAKGGFGRFLLDKVLRLLVPLLVCDLTHAALQIYLWRINHGTFAGTFWQYVPHYFTEDLSWQGEHLWYLWVLFVCSVALYPLMRWLRAGGQGVLSWLTRLLARPAGMYAVALPTILALIVVPFDSPLMQLSNAGWPLFLYVWCVLAGFLLVASEAVQATFQRLRWLSLAAGLVLTAVFIALFGLGATPSELSARLVISILARIIGSWCMVLAVLGLGRAHLNRSTPWLGYANEAVLPFYILHQTVIVGVAQLVIFMSIPDLLKWVIIVPVSFAVIMALYELAVRRWNVMRVLFGMKPLSRKPAA